MATVIRELKQLDEDSYQNKLRGSEKSTSTLKAGRVLEDLARDNDLSVLEAKDRKLLVRQLQILKEQAPVVHFSFPSEPSRGALDKIVDWLRNNINHHCLVGVGLEPSINIGFMVRTQNKIIDCSLKNSLKDNKTLLQQSLQKAIKS